MDLQSFEGSFPAAPVSYGIDPTSLLGDVPGASRLEDREVRTTLVGLARVAYVACEAASRIERCGDGVDAIDWMCAPRDLFAGRSAVEACVDEEECARGVLLHMLEADLDADVDGLDVLMAGEADRGWDRGDGVDRVAPTSRVYSCRTVITNGERVRWCFDAFVAADVAEARRSLAERHGPAAAAGSLVREGFDRHDGFADALLSSRLADTIEMADRDPGGAVARGLDVSVSQSLLRLGVA